MLVELGVVEQRYPAVLEVLSGVTVTDVARRYGVARQTVHKPGCAAPAIHVPTTAREHLPFATKRRLSECSF